MTDHVPSAIESILLKTPANYPYQLATIDQRSWLQEDCFAREHVRRIIIAMNSPTACLASNGTNHFRY